MLYTLQPSAVGTPVVSAGDSPGMIINRDITNFVLLSGDNSVDINSQDVDILDPLTYMSFDGKNAIYASAVSGTPLIDVVTTENPAWAPSPAQAAAQIAALGLMKDTTGHLINGTLGVPAQDGTVLGLNTGVPNNIASTGVPLLTKSTLLLNQSGTLVAGPGSTFGPFSVNQPSYHVFWSALDAAAGTQHKTAQVDITWSDSTSGMVVQIDRFFILPGATGGVSHKVVGDGPTKGDTVTVTLTNNDTANLTYAFVLVLSSRFFSNDIWRTLGTLPAATGFTVGGQDVPGLVLADTNVSIASGGGNATRQLPLYTGPCNLEFNVPATVNGNATLNVITEDPNTQNLGFIYSKILASGSRSYEQLTLPNAETYIQVTNNGTVTGSIGWFVTAIENQ